MDALRFAPETDDAIELTPVAEADFEGWHANLSEVDANWVETAGFKAKAGSVVVFPDASGGIRSAAFGLGDPTSPRNERVPMAAARA